mgnify:CR=1 FL=1
MSGTSCDELKATAIDALTLAEKLQSQLLKLTIDKGGREAVQDALGSTRAAAEILTEWYGKEPA